MCTHTEEGRGDGDHDGDGGDDDDDDVDVDDDDGNGDHVYGDDTDKMRGEHCKLCVRTHIKELGDI